MAGLQIGPLCLEALTLDRAMALLLEWLRADQRRYVSACTAYNWVLAHDYPAVRAAMAGADVMVADGMPLVWLQRLCGFRDAERIYGPDVMCRLCSITADQPVRHFFYGGAARVADKLAARLRQAYPGLQIAGAATPPLLPMLDIQPDQAVVKMLNEAVPDIIWVGLGSPRQDVWMAAYRPYLTAPLLIGVGAAFDFVSGGKPQAPRWMRQSGLEWAFRLFTEPRRLWRRYLLYNPRFIWLLLNWYIHRARES